MIPPIPPAVLAALAEKAIGFVVAFKGRWTQEQWAGFVRRRQKQWGPLGEAVIRTHVDGALARFHEGRARLFLCRGCCCGNPERIKADDYDVLLAHLERERRRLGLALPVEVTPCQGPCAEGNVATLRSGDSCRLFSHLNGPAAVTAMAEEIARNCLPS